MATVKVWLCDWEQECCGPSRRVGDEVTMSVFLFDGEYCEKRHVYDRRAQEIRGRIEAIEWATDAEEITEGGLRRVIGYGPGMSLTTTDDLPDEKSEGSWSVAFTIATGDPLPLGH